MTYPYSDPEFRVGQNVHFDDDDYEQGVVLQVEYRADEYWYQVKFEDQPQDWVGYWYRANVLVSNS